MDFGAMAPIGPSSILIGTPPFTPPEVLGYQPLDARTDIYSLGSTFYYLSTGNAAYPAKAFSQLNDLWQWTPPTPSERVAGIPAELDSLVMSMINLDSLGRPFNAIEVMERLSAIAGIEIDERLVVSKSYLSTPCLVGRENQLGRIEDYIERTREGQGYETRAQVAMATNDLPSYEQNAERCARNFNVSSNPVLAARFQKLKHKARRAKVVTDDDLTFTAENETKYSPLSTLMSEIRDAMIGCADARERAGRLLDILVERCSALGGFLYSVQNQIQAE